MCSITLFRYINKKRRCHFYKADSKDCPFCHSPHKHAVAYRLTGVIRGCNWAMICPETGREVLFVIEDEE